MRNARLHVVSGGEGVDVLTWSRGGVDILTWSRGGRWLTIDVAHLLPPPFSDRMTNTCENITFARFATRAVISDKLLVCTQFYLTNL